MKSEFTLAEDVIYLNHAAVAPWPCRTAEAVSRFAWENAKCGAAGYARWLKTEQELRGQLCWLINAPSVDDIALVKNTSEALSLIAYGLDWRSGDNIVSIAQEFPSNRIVWESLADQGVELRLLDLYTGKDPEGELIAMCDHNTRLVSVSSVQYARGLLLDLEKLGIYCRSREILFCVDAIQSLGAIPFDVQACQADLVVADGHKWMLGPEGLALFYSRREIRDRLRLRQFGWHMVQHAGDFDRRDWIPARSARRFECGSPNMLGIHALQASLSLLQETGLEVVQQRIAEKTARLIELVDHYGCELLSPRNRDRRAGIVTFRMPGCSGPELHAYLVGKDVICALRGGGIRFSPHFYTQLDHLDQAMKIVADFLA